MLPLFQIFIRAFGEVERLARRGGKNQWEERYLASAEFGKELRRQHGILKDVLGELGMVQ